MSTVTLNWAELRWVAIGIFAVVGIVRGFRREVFTSSVLLLLNLMIVNPDAARKIVDSTNNLLKLVRVVVLENPISSSTSDLLRAYSESQPVITDENSYRFFIIVLAAMLILSYAVGGRAIGTESFTPLNGLLGGLLGYINANLVLSLVKDYLLGDFLKLEQAITAQTASTTIPKTLAVEVQNVPALPVLDGSASPMLLGVTIVIILLLAVSARVGLRLPLTRR
jgi:hypothetical protein